jgi:hypothetical protein
MFCFALFYFLLTVSCATAAHSFFVRFLSFCFVCGFSVLCIAAPSFILRHNGSLYSNSGHALVTVVYYSGHLVNRSVYVTGSIIGIYGGTPWDAIYSRGTQSAQKDSSSLQDYQS